MGPNGKQQIGPERPARRRLQIGGATVGDDCDVFVIAEAGVNHNGDVGRALEMVEAGVDAGANAVKFQMFTAESLTTKDVETASYQADRIQTASQREMLSRLELTDGQFERIAERCRARGAIFLATPFSVADLERLLRLEVAAIKIASTDLVDFALLDRSAAAGPPMIASTGAADGDEIARAVERLRGWSAVDRLVLMHCVSCYPTPLEAANLGAIGTIRARFGTLVGYSDHTMSTETGGWAVCAGACVLEKHFTLDHKSAGPDHAMSLEPPELREYIQRARAARQAMGTGSLEAQHIEREVRRLARKRIVAARDIVPGDVIDHASITAKRAGAGIMPTEASLLLGRRAAVPIPADTPVLPEMVR